MIRPGDITKATAALRAQIECLARQAGEQGLSIPELGKAIQRSSATTLQHLQAMDSVLIAQTTILRRRRAFYITHRDVCETYARMANAEGPRGLGPSLEAETKTLRAIEAAAAEGITIATLKERTGLADTTLHHITAHLRQRGKVIRRRDHLQPSRVAYRWYGAKEQPPAVPRLLAGAAKKAAANGKTAQRGPEGPVVMLPGARIEVRDAPPAMWRSTPPEPIFSAAGIGRYEPHDSAIARAYPC